MFYCVWPRDELIVRTLDTFNLWTITYVEFVHRIPRLGGCMGWHRCENHFLWKKSYSGVMTPM